MLRRFSLAVALVLAAALGVPSPLHGPAVAQVAGGTPVFPGIERHRLTFTLPDGKPAVANVLRFDPADLELRPVLARDTVAGLETVVGMGQRKLGEGAVAGINAGFWLSSPPGEPNGYLAIDGRLVSESETQGAGPRGTYGLTAERAVVMDRLDTDVRLVVDGDEHTIRAMNRHYRANPPYEDGPDPIFLYDHRFGGAVAPREEAPRPTRALVVPDLRIPPFGSATGQVVQVLDAETGAPIPQSGSTIIAHGAAAFRLAGVRPGDEITVSVEPRTTWTLPDEWGAVQSGLAAGPLILKNGVRVDPAHWEDEGFVPNTHSDVRHPRSAIGRTEDGQVLLVTVDGRRPGYSHGMTMHELAHYLRAELGVRDAISLDGGGSTQMAIDGVLQNRPCCDASLRPVATGLFVFHSYEFSATERLAGSGREATAAAAARASHPDGANEVLLAAAGNFPDALAGGPLATMQGAPLLLTISDRLSAATRDELRRLGARLVTILGGHAAVSPEVEAELVRSGYVVRRISGSDRSATAAAIARALGPLHERAVLAYQEDFPDALSAAAPAGMLRMPILLTATDALPAATRQALQTSRVREVIVVGGSARIGRGVESELRGLGIQMTRLSGASRYGTARAVNEWAHANVPDLDPAGLVVATGQRFPDALAGGPLAAARRQLLMILPPLDVYADEQAAAYLRLRDVSGVRWVTIMGGHGVVGSYQHWQLDQLAQP